MQTTLRANKRALRKPLSKALGSLPSSTILSQSQAITNRIIESKWFQASKNVSCYLSMPGGEVDTTTLVDEILRTGKKLYVPRINSSPGHDHMDFLQIENKEDLGSLQGGTWGIKEPGLEKNGVKRINAMDDDSEPLDLILLPGVAFDSSLSRLGHGKGYYDHFLSSYTAVKQKPLLVGLALREQIIPDNGVPMGEHDWKMDMVVGPDKIFGGN